MTPEELLKLDWMGRFKQSIQTIKDNKVFWVLKNPNGSYSIPEGKPKKIVSGEKRAMHNIIAQTVGKTRFQLQCHLKTLCLAYILD